MLNVFSSSTQAYWFNLRVVSSFMSFNTKVWSVFEGGAFLTRLLVNGVKFVQLFHLRHAKILFLLSVKRKGLHWMMRWLSEGKIAKS